MPRRLERFDRILLATVLPVWVLCFGLHLRQLYRTGLAVPPVFVSPAPGTDAYPEVAGVRPESFVGDSGLRVGDRLLRVGNADLRGTGYIGFYAVALAEADTASSVAVEVERSGRRSTVAMPLSRHPRPWLRIPGLLAIVAACVIVLWRAPPSSRARLFFAAFMAIAILETPFDGGPLWETYASQVVFYLAGGATVVLILSWSFLFPGEIPASRRIAPIWAWIAGGLWLAMHGAFFVRSPLPAPALPAIAFGLDASVAIACLGALTHNYRQSGPIGKRQVKWILLGAYIGCVTTMTYVLVTLVDAQNRWLDQVSLLVALGFPTMAVGVLIGVIGHHLFDVDRVITATTAYGLFLWTAVVTSLLVVPGLATALSAISGVPPVGAQVVVALALAAVLVPADRFIRPRIERLFFRERAALKQGIGQLLRELSACDTETASFARTAERLDALLSPDACVLYGFDGECYTPIVARSAGTPPPIAADGPLIALLTKQLGPLVRERWGDDERARLGADDRAAIERIGAAVLVPVRHRALLRGFICLGAKRSGDVYTSTDCALLAAVGDKLSVELNRCEEEAARAPLARLRAQTERLPASPHAVGGAQPSPADASRPFIGRQHELTLLRAALEHVRGGRGRLMLLTGEAGAGKTRLAEEFVSEARQCGAQVAWGRCREGVGVRAFYPWSQILRSCVRGLTTDDLRRLVNDAGPMFAAVVPAIRDRLADLPAAPAIESAEARFRLFDGIARFLEGVAEGAPLVVVLDDLHEADRSSLRLLEFLVQDLRHMRVLIVATYREVGVGSDDPLAETFAEVVRDPGSEWVEVRRFGDAEVAELIQAHTGRPAPAELAAAVCRQTEGSPLFVVEFVRVLQAEGRLARSEPAAEWEGIPREVRAVIRRRIGRLSSGCREILKITALAKRALPAEVLIEALRDGAPPAAADEGGAGLREAVVAGILTEGADVPRRYRFAHALIRDTVGEDISGDEGANLHRRLASVLERGPVSDDALAELAHHWFEATAAPDVAQRLVDKAADYARRAAEQAVSMLAYEDAARLYRLALAALDRLDVPDRPQRAALELALGEALRCAGDVPAAREVFMQAAGEARAMGAAELFARAAIGVAGRYGEVGRADDRLCALLGEALAGLPATDSEVRARVMARLAVELTYSREAGRAEELCASALAAALRLRSPAVLTDAFNAGQVVDAQRDPHERLALASEIVRVAERAGDRKSAVEVTGWRVDYLLELGDMRALDAEIARHARLAESLHEPQYNWLSGMFRAMRALHDGDFAAAETLAAEALAHGQRAHDRNAAQAYAAQLFFIRRGQGRLEELRLPLEGLATQYPAMPAWRIGLALLCVESDLLETARGMFEHLAATGFVAVPRDRGWLTSLGMLAEVAAALEDGPRAGTLYGLLLPYAERNISVTGAAVSVGPVARCLGLLAMAMHRVADAERHLEAALAMSVRWRAQPVVARVQCELAELLLRRDQAGDRSRAEELLQASQAAAQQLGMTKLAERVRAAHGGPMAGSAPAPASGEARTAEVRGESGDHAGTENALCREGEYWLLRYRGCVSRVRDRAGLAHLAALVRRPHEEIPALILAGLDASVPAGVRPPGLRGYWEADLGEVLDARARAEYRQRLDDIAEEIEAAERAGDIGRVDRLRAEGERLREGIGAALGLGGRARRIGSPVERARVRVTRALREAIARIAAVDAALGEHLTRSVRTGTCCCYAPPEPTSWAVIDTPMANAGFAAQPRR
jgi:hypothetical protein